MNSLVIPRSTYFPLCIFALTACCLESSIAALTISTNCRDETNIFLPGENVELTISFCPDSKQEQQFEFSCQVSDFHGRIAAEGKRSAAASAGTPGSWTISVAPTGLGVFLAWFTVTQARPERSRRDDKTMIEKGVTFGVFPAPRQPASNPNSPFGICFARLPLARWSSIKWHRRDFCWASIEPRKGDFQFEETDGSLQQAQKEGVEHLAIIDYCAPWAVQTRYLGNDLMHAVPRMEDWRSYVAALVSRYKGRVKAWEIWNEPRFFPKEYAQMLEVAYETAKAIDPDCTVVGMGGANLSFIEHVLQEGAWPHMDAVSIHPYGWGQPPEDAAFWGSIQATDELMRRFGAPKPIWITEFGYPASDLEPNAAPLERAMGKVLSNAVQAAYLVRAYVLAISHPRVAKVFWFLHQHPAQSLTEVLDSGEGILNPDGSVKPAALAYRILAEKIGGAELVGGEDKGGLLWRRTFRKKDKLVSVVWSSEGKRLVEAKVRGKPTGLDTFASLSTSLMGNEFDLSTKLNGGLLPLDEVPFYLEGADISFGEEVVFEPSVSEQFWKPGQRGKINVVLKVPRSTPISGIVALELPAGWQTQDSPRKVRLQTGQQMALALSVNIPASAEPSTYRLNCVLTLRDQTSPKSDPISRGFVNERRLERPVPITVLAQRRLILEDFEKGAAGWQTNTGDKHVEYNRIELSPIAAEGKRSLRWQCRSVLWNNVGEDFSHLDFRGAKQVEFYIRLERPHAPATWGIEIFDGGGTYTWYWDGLPSDAVGRWKRIVVNLKDMFPHGANPDLRRPFHYEEIKRITLNLTGGEFDIYIDGLSVRK